MKIYSYFCSALDLGFELTTNMTNAFRGHKIEDFEHEYSLKDVVLLEYFSKKIVEDHYNDVRQGPYIIGIPNEETISPVIIYKMDNNGDTLYLSFIPLDKQKLNVYEQRVFEVKAK